MELLVTDTSGVVHIVNNNQSIVDEAGFSSPFAVNNSNSTVYYVESGQVFGMPLRNPQFAWVSVYKHVYTFISYGFSIAIGRNATKLW